MTQLPDPCTMTLEACQARSIRFTVEQVLVTVYRAFVLAVRKKEAKNATN